MENQNQIEVEEKKSGRISCSHEGCGKKLNIKTGRTVCKFHDDNQREKMRVYMNQYNRKHRPTAEERRLYNLSYKMNKLAKMFQEIQIKQQQNKESNIQPDAIHN